MSVCRRVRSLVLLASATVSVTGLTAWAQTPAAAAKMPVYDVASIRPNNSNDGRWRATFTRDGYQAKNTHLQVLIRDAYGLYDEKLWSGGPDWLDKENFDIDAKFDGAEFGKLTQEQQQAMLQKLLADRFRLVVHHQMKEFPVYALAVANKGPKLQVSKPEEIQHRGADGTAICLITRNTGRGDFALQGCSASDLAFNLTTSGSADLGRTVVDQTGLTERYNFALHWRPDTGPDAGTLDSSGSSIFTALQEQLGLQLKPAKAMLDTIVIDKAERPSEN